LRDTFGFFVFKSYILYIQAFFMKSDGKCVFFSLTHGLTTCIKTIQFPNFETIYF